MGSKLGIAVGCCLAWACRPAEVRPPEVTAMPAPEVVLAELRTAGAGKSSLRAEGRVTYFGEKGRVRLKAVILGERPGHFRIETLSPFEQPIDVMACDGARLWLLSGDRLREGPATPENIARLLPLPLYPEEVVDVLLGGVPSGDRFQATQVEPAEEGQWRLHLAGANGERAQLLIDPVAKLVRRSALLDTDGKERVTVDFGDFSAPEGSADGREMPQESVVKLPGRDFDMTIKLTKAQVDVALDPSLFRINAPPGVPLEALDSPGVQVR